jgi:lysophospholipase L1-like esterase
MDMVCKVCGAEIRGEAKFCSKCGVPLSLIARVGAKIVDSESDMTVVAASHDDDEVPTVDAPAIRKPVAAPPAAAAPVIVPPTVNMPPANQLPIREQRAPHILLSKPARTILLVFILAALPLFIPSLGNMLSKDQPYREMLPDPHDLITFKKSGSTSDSAIPPAHEASSETTAENNSSTTNTDTPVIVGSEHPIEDPAQSLNSFYAALARTEAKQPGAITRITHYGDSPITNDGITAPVRRLLQEQFGDAGHGFILVDKPWDWYGHKAITFSSGGGWDDKPMIGGKESDGGFGLGGVSFHANGPGKFARFAPASDGDTGKNFSRMEVYYLQQPSGGQFSVSVNGGDTQTVSTAGDTTSGFYEIKAPHAGANTFEVKSTGGSVRLFGAVLENDGPGIVYDSLGVNGAYAGLLVTVMNENHWIEQLRHRNPNLVIINYGTNESQYDSDSQMQLYEKYLHEVIRRVHEALPQVAILVVSPMDRGKHIAGGKIITWPSIPRIVEMQRRVALEENVAFFNMYQAMGGEGTMAKWYARKNSLVGGDLIHPSPEGAEIVGRLIYEAIKDGYTKYKARAGNQLVAKGK